MAWFNIVITSFAVCFALAGIIDLCFLKQRWGIGESFQKGIKMVGPLILSMAGMISIAPMVSWINDHTLGPLFLRMNMDPSIPLATFLPIDMGGYAAVKLATSDETMALASGIVYASMSGVTFLFILPTASSFLKKDDLPFFGKGLLIGLWGIPFGVFIGALMLGVPPLKMLYNLIFPCLFFAILFLLLLLFPKGTLRVFRYLAKGTEVLSLLFFGIALVRDLVLIPIGEQVGFDANALPFFRYIAPLSEGIRISGNIGLLLCGFYPFLTLLLRWLDRPLSRLAERLHGTKEGVIGPLLSLTNLLSTYEVYPMMNEREKVMNAAFAVGASYALCDHVAFCIAEAPNALLPMIVGKFIAGGIGFGVAFILEKANHKQSQTS